MVVMKIQFREYDKWNQRQKKQLTAHVTSMASLIQIIRLDVWRCLIPASHAKANAFYICLFINVIKSTSSNLVLVKFQLPLRRIYHKEKGSTLLCYFFKWPVKICYFNNISHNHWGVFVFVPSGFRPGTAVRPTTGYRPGTALKQQINRPFTRSGLGRPSSSILRPGSSSGRPGSSMGRPSSGRPGTARPGSGGVRPGSGTR